MEVRIDPITGQPSLLVTHRSSRPKFVKSRKGKRGQDALSENPFAPGNEHITGPEVWADSDNPDRKPDQPDWKVRVIPNKYPIVPHHEVIIYSPRPHQDLPDMSFRQAQRVINAFIQRTSALKPHGQVFLFGNHGSASGASIAHHHAQIMALPTLAPAVKEEVNALKQHFDKKGSCQYCQLIEKEEKIGQRIVWQNESYVIYCPEAHGWPYAMSLMPKIHQASLASVKNEQVAQLTEAFRQMLLALNNSLSKPAYNFWLHSTKGHLYHWHIDIIPRIKKLGAVELGAGLAINDRISPEDAAKHLRLSLNSKK